MMGSIIRSPLMKSTRSCSWSSRRKPSIPPAMRSYSTASVVTNTPSTTMRFLSLVPSLLSLLALCLHSATRSHASHRFGSTSRPAAPLCVKKSRRIICSVIPPSTSPSSMNSMLPSCTTSTSPGDSKYLDGCLVASAISSARPPVPLITTTGQPRRTHSLVSSSAAGPPLHTSATAGSCDSTPPGLTISLARSKRKLVTCPASSVGSSTTCV
mmetsp:Transcript_7927/g.27835  ORF Transcript_7927/g.27835 Transcript_7927/m.27835 type:complete len:212 (-) Transcript_7927:24-659(-)